MPMVAAAAIIHFVFVARSRVTNAALATAMVPIVLTLAVVLLLVAPVLLG